MNIIDRKNYSGYTNGSAHTWNSTRNALGKWEGLEQTIILNVEDFIKTLQLTPII